LPPPSTRSVPSLRDIAEAARAAAQAVARRRVRPSLDRSDPGSLDDTPATEQKMIYSMVPVKSLDKLGELVHPIKASPPEKPYLGIDGSHRKLEAYSLLVAVYSAAVSLVDGAYAVGVYPDTGAYPVIDAGGAPVASLAPDPGLGCRIVATKPLIEPEVVARVAGCDARGVGGCRAVASLGYGRGYNEATMFYENRSLLENAALRYVLSRPTLGESGSRVLIDGPLYATPGLLAQLHAMTSSVSYVSSKKIVMAIYALSYMLTALHRLALVDNLGSRGVTVAGVVKRIHASRLMVRAVARLQGGEALGVDTDPQLVEELVRRTGLAALPQFVHDAAIAVGPIVSVVDLGTVSRSIQAALGIDNTRNVHVYTRVARTGERLIDILDGLEKRRYLAKKSYYLVVRRRPLGYRIYRVELPIAVTEAPLTLDSEGKPVLVDNAERLRQVVDQDAALLSEIAWLTVEPQLEAPLPVSLADRAARAATHAAARIWFQELDGKVTFTYETLLEMAV